MSDKRKFDKRFLETSLRDREASERAWTLICRRWKEIMFGFYDQIFDSGIDIRIAKSDVPYLVLRQKEHWTHLFMTSIDAEYMRRIERMHARHMEVGLTNTAYIISYLYLLEKFHEAVLAQTDDIAEARRLVSAIDAVVSEDIARALKAYNDTAYV